MTSNRNQSTAQGALRWPGDPENVSGADIDFEALAHVLANTCRRGGCMRGYHSVAAHAVIVSEEIEALDGLEDEDRRRLALHALVADAPSAWLRGGWPDSQRAAEPGSGSGPGRAGRFAAAIAAAVREAAGLDAVLDEEMAELLRFVARMAAAAESRDLLDGNAPTGAGVAFPPLKRRIRSDAARQGRAVLARPVPGARRTGGWPRAGRPTRTPDPVRGRLPGKADVDRKGSIWPVMASAVLLSGAVAAAVAAATVRYGVRSAAAHRRRAACRDHRRLHDASRKRRRERGGRAGVGRGSGSGP